jgi:hypothetical protein
VNEVTFTLHGRIVATLSPVEAEALAAHVGEAIPGFPATMEEAGVTGRSVAVPESLVVPLSDEIETWSKVIGGSSGYTHPQVPVRRLFEALQREFFARNPPIRLGRGNA